MTSVDNATTMPSIKEREFLYAENMPKKSGFTPRPVQNLATKRMPKSILSIECNHVMRTSRDQSTHGHPPVPLQLWLEAGKHSPPFPHRPDSQYNSNVWRNFRQEYGFHTNSDGQKMGEMIASMYPLNIPSPSKIGKYTYARFLTDTPLIKDSKQKETIIRQTMRDMTEMRRNKAKSEARNPPLDQSGNIRPPIDFKKYEHRFIPPVNEDVGQPALPLGETRTDIFGQQVPKLKQPHLWKLSYKLSQPQAEQLNRYKEKLNAEKQHQIKFPEEFKRNKGPREIAFHSM